MNKILFYIELIVSFLPFILFVFLNNKANMKKEIRNRQYWMPVFALIYSVVMLIFLNKFSDLLMNLFLMLAGLFEKINLANIGEFIRDIHITWGIYLSTILFNTAAMLLYITIKKILTLSMSKIEIRRNTTVGSVVELFYSYDEQDERWYIKEHFGQARTFIKTIYYGGSIISGLMLFISFGLCMNHLIGAPFYPVFAIIVVGEIAFFIDGLEKEKQKSDLSVQTDNSAHIAMYPLLRKPLKELFGDKLSAEGTTVNNTGMIGGSIEDVLTNIEKEGGHIGKNYSAFIRKKATEGFKPNIDYVHSGYDLAVGKSLLFNTPFYDKLNPYVFYAMNRALLTGGRVMIVLGRHGTENDLYQWCEEGMQQISNIPSLWNISVLDNKKLEEDELPDIGIITRSSVHDLDLHKNNLQFLKEVSFVMIVEPSRLVTTAQIGLNLLIKNCGQEQPITFCSVDQNCDGLVDALSHILMTNITEVSATEYPHGASSFMYWTADEDYLQHRILPGVSRCLGMGIELSAVALKNQVKTSVWYGGDAFPVRDARWIARQYYYDLLEYAQLPTTQETFDKSFQASFNMCNERVNDYSFITVEDDRNNLFEIRRNFATISEKQGFVNVISTEYMLREYMAANFELFTADAKAIPYITADYARTKRNVILTLCLLLCVDFVLEETLCRQLMLLNLETKDLSAVLWKEICQIFNDSDQVTQDEKGKLILAIKDNEGKIKYFEKDETILYKRTYSVVSGKFESVYTIENDEFIRIILDDLQNASYIAEQDDKDIYIGTELKGHVYQKYMPGQFFTLNGKYYEMVSTTADDRILVRRASEHIGGRVSYRQVRNYVINHVEDAQDMGALKTVNNIDIHYQFADFTVETPGYWKLGAYNDFGNGTLVTVNGVPMRKYHHKQILKFDFSKMGDSFTDSVRMTLTNLLNEAFVTLFADNQHFISAITPGEFSAPMTYSLSLGEGIENAEKCIYIVEDSQLDIGLLIAVERNLNRIFQIIADYLNWNEEAIEESIRKQNEPAEEKENKSFDVYEAVSEEKPAEKKGFFKKIGDWFKGLFKKKGKDKDGEKPENEKEPQGDGTEVLTPKQQKKAEKEAKKAERKAAKEAKKAERKAAKEAKKAERLKEKENKKAAKEETSSQTEIVEENTMDEGEVANLVSEEAENLELEEEEVSVENEEEEVSSEIEDSGEIITSEIQEDDEEEEIEEAETEVSENE